MLTHLQAKNFKSWADTGDIRIAPLTGFFGTNSSGKTAILQLLLMLKQTVESPDRQRILHLGDDKTYVDLGTSYNIVHQHQLPGQIALSLQWTLSRRFGLPRQINSMPTTISDRRFASSIKFTTSVDLGIDEISVAEFRYEIQTEDDSSIQVGMHRQKADGQNSRYSLFAEGFELRNRFIRDEIERTPSPTKTLPLPIKCYGFPNQTMARYMDYPFMSNVVVSFEKLFQDIYYLGPLREYPRQFYPWSGERPQDVGRRGEFAIPALLASRVRDPDIETKVASWLRRLGLIYDFRLRPIAENRKEYEVRVRCSPNASEVLVTDVGFGVSQILPVLVLCYYAPEGATLILEQPEIHLHPAVQSGLADLFIEVIKTRRLQIIVESHSEHLLRRLQRRIAEEKDHFTNEDTALYFCKLTSDCTSELIPLEIDPFGNIINYPEGFFGDEMGDLVAMTEAAMKRQIVD